MARRFNALPWPGGIMQQPAEIVRMIKIVELGYERESGQAAEGGVTYG